MDLVDTFKSAKRMAIMEQKKYKEITMDYNDDMSVYNPFYNFQLINEQRENIVLKVNNDVLFALENAHEPTYRNVSPLGAFSNYHPESLNMALEELRLSGYRVRPFIRKGKRKADELMIEVYWD